MIACAETLHQTHRHIKTAKDAAVALAPLAGHLASTLFAIGLVGAGMLAAAILPLATAYSVAESFGHTGKLDGKLKTEPIFYGNVPRSHRDRRDPRHDPRRTPDPDPLPRPGPQRGHAATAPREIIHLCRDQKMMGTLKIGRVATALSWTTFAMIAAAIVALGAYSLP